MFLYPKSLNVSRLCLLSTNANLLCIKLCLFISLVTVLFSPHGVAQSISEKKKSIDEVSLQFACHFIDTLYDNRDNPRLQRSLPYAKVCAWYGALRVAKKKHDNATKKLLEQRFIKLVTAEKELIPPPDHVENNVFGILPFELYLQTGKKEYLEMALPYADKQWEVPENFTPQQKQLADKGYSWQSRFCTDDIFLITILQIQAYRATKKEKYINRAAKQLVAYIDSLQQPNGLFYHAQDAPFFWGRGNGWMAESMITMLGILPAKSVYRPKIMEAYLTMMNSLRRYQSQDGMWRQLLDDETAWEESSCTAMFTDAIVSGIRMGWIKLNDPTFRKAWEALLLHIMPNSDITDVCEAAGKQDNREYYLSRRRITGDMQGQAPMIWMGRRL